MNVSTVRVRLPAKKGETMDAEIILTLADLGPLAGWFDGQLAPDVPPDL
jgi:hypothetical protein